MKKGESKAQKKDARRNRFQGITRGLKVVKRKGKSA